MENEHLDNVVTDLIDNIRGAFLGSIENVVIDASVRELINNWNDHHSSEDWIHTKKELKNWIDMRDECSE
jgi:hypothetical protein